jgi:hypothetical protein
MRFFLISFFGFSFFERKNIFFSHFYFVYQHKSLNVKIFLYIGYVEFFFNNFSLENTLSYNLLTGKYLNINQSFFVIFLLFLKLFLKLNFKDLLNYNIFLKLLNKKKRYIIKKLLYRKKLNFNKKNLIFFIFILLNKTEKLEKLLGFWLILVKYIILIPKFKFIKLFIDNLFNYIFNANNINCIIFSVSNENLNAKFLARFIARRLQQGFSIRQVIRPIIKDLLRTNKFSTAGDLEQKRYLNKNKYLFKHLLNKYLFLFKYLLKTNTLITIEFFNCFLVTKKQLKNSIVIKVFVNYFKYFLFYQFYLNYFAHNYYYLNKYNNNFFLNLFKTFKSTKNVFFEKNIFCLNVFLINLSFFFLNSFLKLQYLNFCGNDLYKINKTKVHKKSLSMLGFKFHFVGRFSRRQRASSI